ncbi:hypothetical protein VOLCADRAFT_120551 [Volvox carteri f. nagariensis]|uniref:DEK-C domain-containing protein n=1 Tax=Volvox carteri f. nagariensis TaxID=3068 RepID=D8TN54_VOLCA|nr:uncharacterized protein VOLCADRAFT_120551 [Volvox carteri f. nagariensis]EFJ50930.1 hypothetical protein VOLCADRAFT_120551 [Volvox carteri f. nagariensis]|eukprot:XP_002947942.1 hypothetical protein VOLCADRAFT_120551 [Volvox carteri f. nagariensis]
MADDKPAEVEVAKATEEVSKHEDRTASARKKSLGGLDTSSVLSGPRQRKKAEHFQVEVKEKPEFVIKAGKGTKLGDIPNVHYLLGKLKTDDELVTSLHNLLFKRPGTSHRRKKNLYEFSGLSFDDDEKEKELEKLQERLGKWTIPLLNGALDVFELPRGNGDEGKKEAKVERLLKFLEEPKKLSEKDLAAEALKKKDAVKAKKEKEQKSKTPKSAAKGAKKSEGAQESGKKKRTKKAESDEEPGEAASEEEEAEEEEEEAPEPEEQPKKRAKKADVGLAKKATEKTPSRRASGRKRKAGEEEAAEPVLAEEADEADSSIELPSDEEIKEAAMELLKVSDVDQITVKILRKQLAEKFGVDLSKKKALIKRFAFEYAKATKAAAPEEAGDEGTGEGVEEAVAGDTAPPLKKQKSDVPEEGSGDADAIDAEQASGAVDAEPAAEPEDAEPAAEPEDAEPEAKEAVADDAAHPESAQPEDAEAPTADATEPDKPKEADVADSQAAEAANGKAAGAGDAEDQT